MSAPTTPKASTAQASAPLAASTAAGGAGGPTTRPYFEKERAKLVGDIADGIESLLSNSNALNRKLEESISVGKEFEPIAGLWSRFVELMTASGIPDANGVVASDEAENAAASAAAGQGIGEEEEEGEEGLRRSVGAASLPKGVAPGGGIIYGRE